MENLNLGGITINMANAGLTSGTASGATYTTTATTVHVINGLFGTTLAAQTNTASPTTDARTGAAFAALNDNEATVFVWGVTAAGAIAVCQGSIEDTQVGVTTVPGAFIVAPQFPMLPDDFCPIGYSVHRCAPSASAWTLGTSAWNATGTVHTFKNVCVMPTRPQTT